VECKYEETFEVPEVRKEIDKKCGVISLPLSPSPFDCGKYQIIYNFLFFINKLFFIFIFYFLFFIFYFLFFIFYFFIFLFFIFMSS
jgi:hypothetical protein